MSRTFLVCFEPMRLLPSTEKARLPCFYNFDYYNMLGEAAVIMRWRQQQLLHYADRASTDPTKAHSEMERFAKCAASIESHTELSIERIIGLQFTYYHLLDEVAALGEYMQKLLPFGVLSDVKLAYLHRRGAWYMGVVT